MTLPRYNFADFEQGPPLQIQKGFAAYCDLPTVTNLLTSVCILPELL